MAFAIIWIVVFHMKLVTGIAGLDKLINIGYAGSDIFYFVSGIGIWFSLEKSGDILLYYKKRLLRIMPMYWIFMCFWIPFRVAFFEMKPLYVGLNVLGIAGIFDIGEGFNWYISFLILFYIVAPLIKWMMDLLPGPTALLFIFALFFILGYVLVDDPDVMIGITRFPIFAMGMHFGKRMTKKEDGRFSVPEVIFWLLMIPVGIGLGLYFGGDFLKSWSNGLLWYPYILSTPGICMLLSMIFAPLPDWVSAPMDFIGKHTLSIYFIHVFFFEIYEKYLLANGFIEPEAWQWFVILAAVVPGCIVLELLTHLVTLPFLGGDKD